jgi:hypothetical protein
MIVLPPAWTLVTVTATQGGRLMSKLTRATALTAAGALLAAPAVVLTTASAQAGDDRERHGKIGSGRYEFSVEREHGRFDVDADIDGVRPGTRWKIVLKQEGKRFYKRVLTADREGEVEIKRDLNRPNTKGKDVFVFKAKRVGGTAHARSVITVR